MAAVELQPHPLFALVADIWRHCTANQLTCSAEDLMITITPSVGADNAAYCTRLRIELARADQAMSYQKIRGVTLVTETLLIGHNGWCNFQICIQTNIPSLPASTIRHIVETIGFIFDQNTPPEPDHHCGQRLNAIVSLIETHRDKMIPDQIDRFSGYWSVDSAGKLVHTAGQKR